MEDLIQVARHGTVAQLETVVRGLRTVDHNEPAADPGEYVKEAWTSDSRCQLSARLDPERGAVVAAAIDAIVQRDGCTPAEALERVAQICLASLADAGNPPRDLRGHERAAVVIHVDAARVRPRSAEPDPGDDPDDAPGDRVEVPLPRSAEPDPADAPSVARPYARVAGGPGLPDEVVRRLLCDGRIRTVIHDGPNVLDVGRSHRLVTDRQYRALLLRHHNHCAHPGCPNAKNLHAHHRIHWIHGGRTDLDNLLLLCERHHLAHHCGEFEVFTLG
ncbi:MAG TPA: HNH endonuclease signature motif containing protein, partial [Acidothermaceae bacterium]